jgi:hypothetical protein
MVKHSLSEFVLSVFVAASFFQVFFSAFHFVQIGTENDGAFIDEAFREEVSRVFAVLFSIEMTSFFDLANR